MNNLEDQQLIVQCNKCKGEIIYSWITGVREDKTSAPTPIAVWCIPCVIGAGLYPDYRKLPKFPKAKPKVPFTPGIAFFDLHYLKLEPQITISKQEYQSLLEDRNKFYALKSAALSQKEAPEK